MFKFSLSGKKDINAYINEYNENPETIYLLDVRADDEYLEKHIPGSIHLPLSDLDSYDIYSFINFKQYWLTRHHIYDANSSIHLSRISTHR